MYACKSETNRGGNRGSDLLVGFSGVDTFARETASSKARITESFKSCALWFRVYYEINNNNSGAAPSIWSIKKIKFAIWTEILKEALWWPSRPCRSLSFSSSQRPIVCTASAYSMSTLSSSWRVILLYLTVSSTTVVIIQQYSLRVVDLKLLNHFSRAIRNEGLKKALFLAPSAHPHQ